MKEIEVKIYGIDPAAIRKRLRELSAREVKDVFQRNVAYQSPYTKQRKMSVRIRYERAQGAPETAKFTVKTARRIVKNHKVQEEYETPVHGKTMDGALRALGFNVRGTAEMKRAYFLLHGASVEICQLPRVPAYLELEGSEEQISKAAHALGFSEKDYDNTPPREKFSIPKSKKNLTF